MRLNSLGAPAPYILLEGKDMSIIYYWDEIHKELWQEIFIQGKKFGIVAEKVHNAENIEMNCMVIDGYYYEIECSIGPLVRIRRIG